MELTTITHKTVGNELIIYECDGTCNNVFLRHDLLTVPTAKGHWVCDDCAETHFNIPITDADSTATSLTEMDSNEIPDSIHNTDGEMINGTTELAYNTNTRTIVEST